MVKITLSVLLATLCVSVMADRSKESFDTGWQFFRCGDMPDGSYMDEPAGLEEASQDDSDWRTLNLPHDWAIEGPFRIDLPGKTGKLPYPGIGWYRKHFTLADCDKGKNISVLFDGAMSNAKVWVNGQYVGQWPYGYNSFHFDITDKLNFGSENVIAVRLDSKPDSSRWYPGAGIYRHTYLIKTNPVCVDIWGTFITTPQISENSATIQIAAELLNKTKMNQTVDIKHSIYEPDNKKPVAAICVKGTTLQTNQTNKSSATITIGKPKLWSIENPNIYYSVTEIMIGGEVVDTYKTPFGIRSIAFDAGKGFVLNGEVVELKGVCMHHDLGPLGSAMNKAALKRQLVILQSMGCNAIRTSHNMPTPEMLELCDKLGLVVLDEAFDCWESGKTKNDYHNFYKEWHEKDIVNFIRRDRNHPSVILWSSGNEVGEQGKGEHGKEVSRSLTAIFHREDPTRLVTVGCNYGNSGFNGFQETFDVFGFNYKPHLYEKFVQENPNIPFFSSESASCISTRGEYFFPVEQKKDKGFFNYQVSSYDLYAPAWASKPDIEFVGQDTVPQCAGEFVWTGFDYIGEPTPYNNDKTNLLNFTSEEEKAKMLKEIEAMGGKSPSRSSYFGIIDLCGFPKDRFYLYQARWRQELPMAHILPHWNWQERLGEITPVHVYTSGDEAELFLNGKSLGRKKMGELEYRIVWDDVKYQPGELKAVAYKDGKKWATDIMRTTGWAKKIDLTSDKKHIKADGTDLSFITVQISDKNGLLVPKSDNLVSFEIEGPGEIVAVGNGNPISHESFQAMERKAFNGLCLAVVRSIKGETGKITITAKSKDLSAGSVIITAK